MEGASSIIMLVVLVAVFYFMLIRPENKRKKQAQAMRDSLKKGDTITTIGGIVGKIVTVKPDTIVIETSDDRVRMELTKWAVSTTGVQSSETQTSKKKEEEKKDEVTGVRGDPRDRLRGAGRSRGRGKEGLTHHKSTLPCHMLQQSLTGEGFLWETGGRRRRRSGWCLCRGLAVPGGLSAG